MPQVWGPGHPFGYAARGGAGCDLNYRGKLWTREKAGEAMGRLMRYVDVLIANEEDAKDVFGIEAADTDIMSGKLNQQGYISMAEQLTQRFHCKAVAVTLRGSISASENNWAGMPRAVCSGKTSMAEEGDKGGREKRLKWHDVRRLWPLPA